VNSVNSKIAKLFTSFRTLTAVAFVTLSLLPLAQAWEVDFSRRQLEFDKVQDYNRMPASERSEKKAQTEKGLLSQVFDSTEVAQDIVITNTEKGFIPSTLRLRKGGNYKIHVVNVNQKEKNVSFVLDAFSEQHNTVFGNIRSFTISPKQDGIFSYQCPETAQQGQLVIFSDERKPASE
jgi:hypothetical protein